MAEFRQQRVGTTLPSASASLLPVRPPSNTGSRDTKSTVVNVSAGRLICASCAFEQLTVDYPKAFKVGLI